MLWAEQESAVHAELMALLRDENPDIDDQTLRDTVEGIDSWLEAMDWLQCQDARASEMIAALKARMADNAERKTRLETLRDNTRRRITNCMDLAGERKVVLPEATLSIRKGMPKVIVTDENAIPSWFKDTKTTVTVNKTMIANCLTDDPTIDIPGAELAELYSLQRASEAVMLSLRLLWYVDSYPGSLVPAVGGGQRRSSYIVPTTLDHFQAHLVDRSDG